MDKKTENILKNISRNVPSHLAQNVVKTVVDTSEEEVAKMALKDPHISPAKKRRLSKMIDEGRFRQVSTEVNEEVVQQIDEYNSREVEAAIKRGDLADPSTDPFVAKRAQRMRDKQGTTHVESLGQVQGARVLIKPDPKEDTTKFGLILPDSEKKPITTGLLVQVGSKCKEVDAEHIGKRVMFQEYGYSPISMGNELYYIVEESSVLLYFDEL